MMANKKSESQHRLETSRRQEEPFNNPFRSGELTEAARTWESLGAVAKGPTCPDGAGGGRQRFVLQMVEEISGEKHCSGLIRQVTLGQLLTLIPVQRGWVHTYMHIHIHPKAHTRKRQPLKACLTRQTDQPSPGTFTQRHAAFKELLPNTCTPT